MYSEINCLTPLYSSNMVKINKILSGGYQITFYRCYFAKTLTIKLSIDSISGNFRYRPTTQRLLVLTNIDKRNALWVIPVFRESS